MLILQVTSDKILTAFLGASIAFGLKIIYDAYLEFDRRNKIRAFVDTDLKRQFFNLNTFIGDFKNFKKAQNGEKKSFPIRCLNPINTNVYKAYSEREYALAFNTYEFNILVSIYLNLSYFSSVDSNKLFEEIKYEEQILRTNLSNIIKQLEDLLPRSPKNFSGTLEELQMEIKSNIEKGLDYEDLYSEVIELSSSFQDFRNKHNRIESERKLIETRHKEFELYSCSKVDNIIMDAEKTSDLILKFDQILQTKYSSRIY